MNDRSLIVRENGLGEDDHVFTSAECDRAPLVTIGTNHVRTAYGFQGRRENPSVLRGALYRHLRPSLSTP